MKLRDIHKNFNTDKGTAHSYIDIYDNLFEDLRTKKLNFLEIGVLLGGSLKMWEHFFENSTIYGVDDFSQENTDKFFGEIKVNPEEIVSDLSAYERIKFIQCDSRNKNKVEENIGSLNTKFDVIIDDGEHSIPCQKDNFDNFFQYLKSSGIYIVEDCRGEDGAKEIKDYILKSYENLDIEIYVLNVKQRSDDVMMTVRRKLEEQKKGQK